MTPTRCSMLWVLCGVFGTCVEAKQACIGSASGFSIWASGDKLLDDDRYRSLKEQYEGCTHVEGNLELTFLRSGDHDMTFLKDIQEVSGYVLIVLVYQVVSLPNLRVIRGTDLYEDHLALYVATTYHATLNDTGSREVHFPLLHEIVRGNVMFQDNRDLCYVHTIDWSDMRDGLVATFADNGASCTTDDACAAECPGGCWGPTPSMCQILTRKNCSETCDYRCSGPTESDCCHRSCAAGCTGPSHFDCLACLKFTMDNQCVDACPPRTMYNPETFQNESNPDFRFTYGSTCLTSCPDHVLEEGGVCVHDCPAGSVQSRVPGDTRCVECDGPCPKVCDGTADGDHLYKSDFANGKLSNCTIIRNNLFIGSASFSGDSFSGKEGITVHMLAELSSVHEIQGYLVVQASAEHFTNLTFLRNLRTIYGRQLFGRKSLNVVSSSLQSLNLVSLERIEHGTLAILWSSELCYVKDSMFIGIIDEPEKNVRIVDGPSEENCAALGRVCDPQCAPVGCWGPGPEQCAQCLHAQIDGKCIPDCDRLSQYAVVVSKGSGDGPTICARCPPECRGSCTGPGLQNCTGCPPGFRFDDHATRCVVNCSENLFFDQGSNQCVACHQQCLGGCFGNGSRSCFQCKNVQHDNECLQYCPQDYENDKGTCVIVDDSNPTGLIVGVCIAVLALLVLIIVGCGLYHQRRTQRGYEQTSVEMKDVEETD